MKCRYCGSDNIMKANYCSACGQQMPEEDRQKAWNATVYGKIEMLEKAKAWVTLEAITSHPFVRALMLVLILAYGLLLYRTFGNKFAVRNSTEYTVAYNKDLDEYYIGSGQKEFNLNLYVPGKAESILVDTVNNADHDIISRETYTSEDAISIANTAGCHYILTADYGSRQRRLVIYIVSEEELS
ncbi:MAG: hypothetical protein K6C06_06675 [Lachnospiraceae bacterium]|nr:hypothetical protein [Lachnospiraceae bacterium]